MKKVLLATSILAASAGFAAAEVEVSGNARMGLYYDGDDTYYSSRVRIIFTASGETDGGLSFGAEVRNDQSGQGNTANGDSTVYISGAFGTLTFGDVDSAANVLVGDASAVGFTNLGFWNELTYLIGDYYDADTSALYEYSNGALSFALSTTQVGTDAYSVAVKYSTDAYGVALGYENVDGYDAISVGGSATFSAITVKAAYIKYEDDFILGQDSDFVISADYKTGAVTVTGFYSDFGDALGLGAAYNLGGGASVKGGLVNLGDADETIADIGITMSF